MRNGPTPSQRDGDLEMDDELCPTKQSAFAGFPDLFGRVALDPLGRGDVLVDSRRSLGYLYLDEVFDLKPVRAEEPDRLAVREAELDAVDRAVLVMPLGPMHPEEVPVELEVRGGGVVALRVTGQQQGVPAEEDQPSARPQQPGRLRDPPVRVAPDRRAVLGQPEFEALVVERRALGVCVHEREPEVELRLEGPGGRGLPARGGGA